MAALVQTDQLEQLLRRLQPQRGSQKICGEISAKIDNVMTDYEFYVDSWPEPKAVVSTSDPRRAKFRVARHCVNVFATDGESLKALLLDGKVIDWRRKILFSGVAPSLTMALIEAIRQHNVSFQLDETCTLMNMDRTRQALIQSSSSEVPEGLRLDSLGPSQSDQVNMDWKFSTGDASETYIHHLIKTRPSVALYNTDGHLLGYALVYHYGCVGILHVPEQNRGKGYEKLILTELIARCSRSGVEPFVFVEDWNKYELEVYKDIGFQTVMYLQWVRCNY